MLSVSLGHEIVAVIAVVAAFFIGLALGAFCLNNIIRNTRSPQLWYAGLEVVICVWALLLTYLIPTYNQWLPTLIGNEPSKLYHWSVAFGSSLLLLLPATAAMGATLPAIERIFSGLSQRDNSVARLYAFNTLGAVLGTLITTFILIPALGLSRTQMLLACGNALCAMGIIWLFPISLRIATDQACPADDTERFLHPIRLLATLFCTGLLGIGYEILVVRMLSQILENTVYSFAAVLCVYLLGVAIGAYIYQRTWAQNTLSQTISAQTLWMQRLATLLTLTACACLLGIAALWLSNELYLSLLNTINQHKLYAISTEILAAALVFFIPTLSMGALFSHLAQGAVRQSGLGRALGLNTLGAALAPLLFAVVLLPMLGAKLTLAIAAAGYLLLLPTLNKHTLSTAALPLIAVILLLASPFPLRFVAIPQNNTIISYDEGIMAAVAVTQDQAGDRHLKVNNHFTMGGTASRFSDHRQTHIPMLLQGAPTSALYLGLGTGITFEASQYYPNLSATGVELIPESINAMPQFGVDTSSSTWHIAPKILAADARRFVLSSNAQYDVVIAEIFHPSRDGAGSLYTQEHFSAIKQRLSANGVFCQWLPLFQLDLTTLKTIVRTFVSVFPYAQLHLGHFSLQQPILCLAGFKQAPAFSENWLLERVHDKTLQQQLVQMRLNSDFALFGGFLGAQKALANFAGEGPINTDDLPVITYSAPDFVYSEAAPAAVRLAQLIEQLAPLRSNLSNKTDLKFSARLEAYWQARDEFIKAGLGLQTSNDIRQIIASSKDDLLRIVKHSSDFEPAYRTLIMSAQALNEVDRYGAYQLLTETHNANPHQPQALHLRQRLFGN